MIELPDGTYICAECGKVFTPEQAEQIERVCRYFECAHIKSRSAVRELLTEDILPVKYYYTAPNEVVHCGTEAVIPHTSGLWCK